METIHNILTTRKCEYIPGDTSAWLLDRLSFGLCSSSEPVENVCQSLPEFKVVSWAVYFTHSNDWQGAHVEPFAVPVFLSLEEYGLELLLPAFPVRTPWVWWQVAEGEEEGEDMEEGSEENLGDLSDDEAEEGDEEDAAASDDEEVWAGLKTLTFSKNLTPL